MSDYPTFEEFNIETSSFCADDNVMLVIKRTLESNFSEIAIPYHFYDEVKWHYFPSECSFTCVHFDDDGKLQAIPKSAIKKQMFMEFSTPCSDGHRRLCHSLERVQMYWRRHGDYTHWQSHKDMEMPVKWGKIMKEILPNTDSDEMSLICDALAAKAREILSKHYDVQVSSKPSEIYTMPSDFKSCMIGLNKEKFLIYDDIEATSIAYIVGEDNMLKARALLYNTTFYKKPMKIMDRIYYHDSYYLAAMVKWANEHGYWHKTRQSMDWYQFINAKGEVKSFRSLRIPAPNIRHRYIDTPYIDTFCKVGLNKDDELCLTMKGARPHKVVGVLQAYNRRHVPYLLQDMEAVHCSNCNGLHRKENITMYLGYDGYRNADRPTPVCKSCAKNLVLCPMCGKHYIWNNLSGYGSYFGRYTMERQYGDSRYIMAVCGHCFHELDKATDTLVAAMFEEHGKKKAA